ncbi:MAG: DNA translocase FtsK 4TM domain-containing protein [Candidatus Competibacteraceae bacterium]
MAQAQRIKTDQPVIRVNIIRLLKGMIREVSFWLVIVIALGMISALATFNAQDPAWTQTAEVAQLHNLGGVVGAWFADVTLYFFGYPAYLLPLGVAFASWRLFKRGALLELDAEVVLFRVLGFAVALATACGLAALHLQAFPGTVPGEGTTGGLVGVHVGQFLVQAFGFVGGNLFMVALLLSGLTLMTGVPWLTMVDWVGAALLKTLDGVGWMVMAPVRWMMGRQGPRREETEPVGGGVSTPEEPGADSMNRSTVKTVVERWRPILAGWAGMAMEKSLTWWRMRRATTEVEVAAPVVLEKSPLPPGRIEPMFNGQAEPPKSAPIPVRPVAVTPLIAAEWAMEATLIPSSPSSPTANYPGVDAPILTPAGEFATVSPLAGAPTAPLPPVATPSASVQREEERPEQRAASTAPVAVMARRVAPPSLIAPIALPPLDLLDPPPPRPAGTSVEVLESMSRRVESLLKSFGIEVRVVAVEPGPVITRFEVEPAPGVKVSQISNLAKDLARGLSVISVRVVEIIPGKSVIGLEIPNRQREVVYLREVLESAIYNQSASPLTLALGKDISGHPTMANLAKMPHLLVAGTTGSGKSVAINAMLLSLLYKASPSEVRLILVDPKMLELSIYEDIPHLLTPVVTDMKEAANALRWCVAEMDRRYRLMATLKVRNIAGFNRKVQDALATGEGLVDPFWNPGSAETPGEIAVLQPLPFIVVVIDELADMMMIVGKKVEELIARLAQKARAAGIHLILATQRPSVDVITGLIKANIPTRVAFQVSSRVDSRTILDQMGAEQLLGHGDMLYLPPGTGLPQRVHGAFVDDHEVNRVVDYLRQTGVPDYIDEVLAEPREEGDGMVSNGDGDGRSESDPLYDEAVRIVTESRRASVSGVQRRLRIGYNRAARLVEEMEAAGVVGAVQPNGSREVLAPPPP